MKKVYLDFAATTPIDIRVKKIMDDCSDKFFGNASSVHSFGREAAVQLDQARQETASFLSADFHEVIFTGGATEANNLAIIGLLSKFQQKFPAQKFHLITSTIEHSSVRKCFEYLEKNNLAEVSWLKAGSDGQIDPLEVRRLIKDNTILVSLMMVNNETGVIQPVRKVGKIVKAVNKQKERLLMIERSSKRQSKQFTAFDKVYFHTDAVQAANLLDLNVKVLHVDLLTISAHKIYGPKGVGALYVNNGTPIANISYGGDQEFALRPGTYNLPAIAGLSASCSLLKLSYRQKEFARLTKLRNSFLALLKKNKINFVVNGKLEESFPSILNLSFPGRNGEMLMLQLDQLGYAVSTGSACAAGAVEPSPVLLAMGLEMELVNSAIRISLGRSTNIKELIGLVKALKETN